MKFLTFLLFPCLLAAQNHDSDAAYAAKIGDIATLKILVEKLGVSPNALFEKLPLIFYSKNPRTARYLMDRGASSRDSDGRTMLMLQAGSGDKKMFNFFFNKNDVPAKDSQGWTALHYLAEGSGNIGFAKKLIKAGADVNALDDELWTPLMLAAQGGKYALTDYLIQSGAKVGLKNKDKKSALNLSLDASTYAVKKEAFEKTAQILKKPAK